MVIGGTAITSGLDLSAGRDVVDETQLWEVEGMYANEDKVLAKRPSFVPWATQIAEPKRVDSGENEELAEVLFLTEEDWGVPTVTGSSASAVYDGNAIVLSGWKSTVDGGPGTASIERTLKDQEDFNTSVGFDSSLTLSFVVQVKDPSFGEFITFEAAVEEDMLKGWTITSDGLAMQTGAATYATILGTKIIVDGNPHRVDLTLSSGVILDVWVDGVKISAGNIQTYSGLTSDYFMKLTAKSQDTLPTTPFVLTMSSVILKDAFSPDIANVLDFPAITDLATVRELKSASFTDINSLLVAGSTHLWYDYSLREIWRPLATLPKPRTRFSQFRGNTIICNYSDSSRVTHVFEYDQGKVSALDNAPLPNSLTAFGVREILTIPYGCTTPGTGSLTSGTTQVTPTSLTQRTPPARQALWNSQGMTRHGLGTSLVTSSACCLWPLTKRYG
jgi:hypothetical protein